MFTKILIANRGEIACRIIKTARQMGVKTVAVYSDADANSRHVSLADEAVRIGPPPVSESYLNVKAIVDAALKTGAQAIHPGYGFLSENPDFVDAVEKAGLVFIGPSAKAIRAMGLKDAAKTLMVQTGVPVVPGYHGSEQDAEFLKSEADKIGYPVLIKARAGGGGKGMRLVQSPDEFLSSLESAAREGQTAFGDPAVLIEKYITSPRHIEVQVFGDSHGNVVHMFERDCSLQRRHQKVIEEAPAPNMTDDVRTAMTDAAVKAAKAISYEGAGTIEFIVDGSGPLRKDGFWFMEMNTRLQVEHPVTEAITGLDLVELQLRVASGAPLPMVQDDIKINGHAFEARLYAEDVPAGFLPSTGRLEHLQFSKNSRNDTGVRSGDEISPYYDPMIAKVITHGTNRTDALALLTKSLGQTHIAGVTTNIAFLQKLSTHQGFSNGDVDTGLIERDLAELTEQPDPEEVIIGLAMLAALDIDTNQTASHWRLWGAASRLIKVMFNGQPIERRFVVQDQSLIQILAADNVDTLSEFEIIEQNDQSFAILSDGVRKSMSCVRYLIGQNCYISILSDGQTFEFSMPDPLDVAAQTQGSANSVIAPMSGIVRLVTAQEGDHVKEGDRLVVLEAMKMEMNLAAPCSGQITQLTCQQGDAVEGGTVLVQIKADE